MTTLGAALASIMKLAEKRRDHGEVLIGGGAAAIGTGMATGSRARGRLLGYKRVYHGTTPEIAEKIRREGLKASMGGTGAAADHAKIFEGREVGSAPSDYEKASKGRVHVTGKRSTAGGFAAFRRADANPGARVYEMMGGQIFPGRYKKGIIEAHIPDELWQKFEVDPDAAGRAGSVSGKHQAARGAVDVDPRFIRGSEGFSRRALLKERLRGLPSYIKRNPIRFAKGVGAVGGGAGLAAYGLHRATRTFED